MADNDMLTVTLVVAETGQSEAVPVSKSTTAAQVLELAGALWGITGASLMVNGKPLDGSTTLQQAGIKTGDLLAISTRSSRPAAAAPSAGGGGLDFSSLLGSSGPPAPAAPPSTSSHPVYFPGMSLNEAMAYNPHPEAFVSLLLKYEHLWKELHHHNPKMAVGLKQQPSLAAASQYWRSQIVQGSIEKAVAQTEQFHEERTMQARLSANPSDAEAVAYFAKQKHEEQIQQQFHAVMEEYPESLGRVLMLYVPARINGHEIQAFCDSGAQSTIMSKKLARETGLLDLVDERFAGMAAGVGTGKILGRVHLVQLQMDQYYFPCTVTVMDDPKEGATEMPFLLGLDMMKRHLCQIDLEAGVLRFRVGTGSHMEVPFLHEKDLDQAQGGTRGFNAELANAQLLKDELEDDKKKSSSNNNNK